jgi:hypothetical protein
MSRVFIRINDGRKQEDKLMKNGQTSIFISYGNVIAGSGVADKKCFDCVPCVPPRPNCFTCTSCSQDVSSSNILASSDNNNNCLEKCGQDKPYCQDGKCVQCTVREHCINGLQYCDDGVCKTKGSSQCIF